MEGMHRDDVETEPEPHWRSKGARTTGERVRGAWFSLVGRRRLSRAPQPFLGMGKGTVGRCGVMYRIQDWKPHLRNFRAGGTNC